MSNAFVSIYSSFLMLNNKNRAFHCLFMLFRGALTNVNRCNLWF